MTFFQKIKKFKIRRRSYFIFNFLLLILLLTLFLNQYIKPSFSLYFSLVALIFPVLFIFYIITSFVWFFKNYKIAIIYFLFACLFLVPLKRIYNFYPNKNKNLVQTFKIVSFNTRYTYDTDIDRLEQYLEKLEVNIVFLQEIYSRQWKDEKTFFTDRNNAVYPYVGISTQYPIINSREISLPFNGHSCMADILIKNDTIRLLNVYLEPMYITKKIFEINSISELTEKTELLKNKLAEGFKIHEKQVQIIKKYIEDSPYPIIVAGDFNSVPNSYEYFALTENLNDSFLESGKGLGTTFHDYYYPLKIDYILYDNHFVSQKFYVDRTKKYSDHFPISVELKLK